MNERIKEPWAAGLDDSGSIIASLEDCLRGPRYRGGVDGFHDGKVTGWIVDLTRPMSVVVISLLIDDVLLQTKSTSIVRHDLLSFLSPNIAGFEFDLTRLDERAVGNLASRWSVLDEADFCAPCAIHIAIKDSSVILHASGCAPLRSVLRDTVIRREWLDEHASASPSLENLRSGPRYRGGIDGLSGACLSGWAIDLADPWKPTPFCIIAEGVLLGEATTSIRRSDLEPYVPKNVAGFFLDLWHWGEIGPRRVISFLEGLPPDLLDSPCSLLVKLGHGNSTFDAGRFGVSRASLLAQFELSVPSHTIAGIVSSPLPEEPQSEQNVDSTQSENGDTHSSLLQRQGKNDLTPPIEQDISVSTARIPWLGRALEASRTHASLILRTLGADTAGFANYALEVANDPRRLFAFVLEASIARSSLVPNALKMHARSIRDLFDPLYYLERLPNLADNPLLHYITTGWKERRQPNQLFDVTYYLSQVPGLEEDPLMHFAEKGAEAGLNPHPLFDTAFYRKMYLRDSRADWNPLFHYQVFGGAMRFDTSPLFDTIHFLEAVADAELATCPLEAYLAIGDADLSPHHIFDSRLYRYQVEVERGEKLTELPVVHYLKGGYRDRTILPNLLFDPAYYRERNNLDFDGPDLVHYLLHGGKNELACHPLFSSKFYNAQRTDGSPMTALEHALRYPGLGLRYDSRMDKPIERGILQFIRQLTESDDEFNVNFYRAANPDIAKVDDSYLQTHFTAHGRAEGRVASPRALLQRTGTKVRDLPIGLFVDEYIQLNPDLADLADNWLACLVHFLSDGRRENRMIGFWQLYLDDFVLDTSVRTAPRRSTLPESRTQVCVLIHAFYPDLLAELAGFAHNFRDVTYDIFINLVDLAWSTEIHRECRQRFPGAYLQLSNDNGRDLGGFTRLLDHIDLDRYELFAFMHTKKSPHIHEKRATHWRRTLLKAFAGSSEIASACVEMFSADPRVGMIAAKEWRSHHMGNNADQYERMLDILGIRDGYRALDYVSGTMFLVRCEVVKRLHTALRSVEWEYGGDNILEFHMDGQIAHGAERAIPALVRDMGYTVEWR